MKKLNFREFRVFSTLRSPAAAGRRTGVGKKIRRK